MVIKDQDGNYRWDIRLVKTNDSNKKYRRALMKAYLMAVKKHHPDEYYELIKLLVEIEGK